MGYRSLLKQSCTIRRKTITTSSTTAAKKPTWADAATYVACLIQSEPSRERSSPRESPAVDLVGYFPFGTDIRFGDRVVPNTGLWASKNLAVIGEPVDEAGRGTVCRVKLAYMPAGGVL